jgi:hypothetical protein
MSRKGQPRLVRCVSSLARCFGVVLKEFLDKTGDGLADLVVRRK